MSCQPDCAACAVLRAATLELIGEGGIDALNLPAVAQRTGIEVEGVALHYPDTSACLRDTYLEVSASVREDLAAAFARGSSWPEALRLAGRCLLARMASRPAEARLCFIEILRGDSHCRRARDEARQRLLDLFRAERRRRSRREPLADTQLELLIGAGFQAIAAAVADGRAAELPHLEDELAALDGVFEPLPA